MGAATKGVCERGGDKAGDGDGEWDYYQGVGCWVCEGVGMFFPPGVAVLLLEECVRRRGIDG